MLNTTLARTGLSAVFASAMLLGGASVASADEANFEHCSEQHSAMANEDGASTSSNKECTKSSAQSGEESDGGLLAGLF
jgi:hypothetical protein